MQAVKKKKSWALILLVFFILVSAAASVSAVDHYYVIGLLYDQGNLSLKTIDVEPSYKELKATEGRYVAEVVSYENKILNLTFFAVPTLVFYDQIDPNTGMVIDGGITELNQSEVQLYVPYYLDAKEINIYDQELVKRLSIDLSAYSREIFAAENVPREIVPETEVAAEAEIKTEAEAKTTLSEKIKSAEEAFLGSGPAAKIVLGVLIGVAAILVLIVIILILHKIKKRNYPK